MVQVAVDLLSCTDVQRLHVLHCLVLGEEAHFGNHLHAEVGAELSAGAAVDASEENRLHGRKRHGGGEVVVEQTVGVGVALHVEEHEHVVRLLFLRKEIDVGRIYTHGHVLLGCNARLFFDPLNLSLRGGKWDYQVVFFPRNERRRISIDEQTEFDALVVLRNRVLLHEVARFIEHTRRNKILHMNETKETDIFVSTECINRVIEIPELISALAAILGVPDRKHGFLVVQHTVEGLLRQTVQAATHYALEEE